MKRKTFLLPVLILSLSTAVTISCSSEESIVTPTVAAASSTAVMPEVTAFRNAMIGQIKERSSMNKQEIGATFAMHDSPKIVEAAKKLLSATDKTQADILMKSGSSNAVLISLALKEYAKQTQPRN